MESAAGSRERVLFVHAHPDDETISTGGTIATLIDRGAAVTVLTCTRGERGEVIPPHLKHLQGDASALAQYREGELAEAMSILGVNDHRYLGESDARLAGQAPRRYLDSGMQWGPDGAEAAPDTDTASFCAAEFGDVVADIATVIASMRPTAVVSYDRDGGYGHPDHVRAAEASNHAALVMGVPFYSIVRAANRADPKLVVVDVSPVLSRKRAALAAYRTQLTVAGEELRHSGGQVEPITGVETYQSTLVLDADPPFDWSGLRARSRLFACIVAAVVGGAIGIVGTVNHQLTATIAGQSIWVGVVASLLIATVFLAGARIFTGSRIAASSAAIGLLLVVGILSLKGPGGSILVPANPSGWLWAYGPFVIAAIVVAWPKPGEPARATMETTGKKEEV